MRNLSLLLALCALPGCTNSSWSFGGSGPQCEEFACLWQAEQGTTIEEVSSWHEKAYAYRLNGTPARVSRQVDFTAMPACAQVELVANIAKDAQFELQFDFGNDGIIDVRSPVAPGLWERRLLYVRTPASARHLRVHLSKQGPGEAAVEYILLRDAGGSCPALPATLLANDSVCLDDASCNSGHCVLGECSACGAGGCAEGAACIEGKDCLSGGCAAGVCRACAASGSCGQGEGCSASSQCAFGSCVAGLQPSLIQYPEQDGLCGECRADGDCASGHCVLGQCAVCVDDGDCPGGQRCRYDDAFEAKNRACLPLFDGILPRGALCEVDAECADGLRCGAAPDRAKRCGFSCKQGSECLADEVCGVPGTVPSVTQAGVYELLPSYRDVNSRIATCYPKIVSTPQTSGYDYNNPPRCLVNAQCPSGPRYGTTAAINCCNSTCSSAGIDLESGKCDNYGAYDFAQFYY